MFRVPAGRGEGKAAADAGDRALLWLAGPKCS
jgi:hypothetical protein